MTKKPKGKSNSDHLVIDLEDELGENTPGSEAESEDEESPDEEEKLDEEEENGEDKDSHKSDEEMDSNENWNVFYNQFDNIVNESAWFEQGAITSIQSD
jgi:cobalamin biosynthesis protein CobT